MPNEDALIKVIPWYGHIELESRLDWQGDRVIGMGRRKEYDIDGKLTFTSEWEPTGAVIWFDKPHEHSLWYRIKEFFLWNSHV